MPNNPTRDDLPSNSFAARAAQEKAVTKDVKSVVQKGNVRRRRKGKSMANTFFSESVPNAFEKVLTDVLIPAAKSMFSDAVTRVVETVLFGESGSPSRRGRDRDDHSYVSYGSFHRSSRRDERDEPRVRTNANRFDPRDIFFRYGQEADEVLNKMLDLLEKYDWVTVADFLDLAGVEDESWSNQDWGWEDLRGVRCTHTKDGYQIMLPNPKRLI